MSEDPGPRSKRRAGKRAILRLLLHIGWLFQPAALQKFLRCSAGTLRGTLRRILEQAHHRGHLDTSEMLLIRRALSLRAMSLRDIMIPRVSILALSEDDTVENARAFARRGGVSQIVVFREHLDQITGVLLVSDLLDPALNHSDPISSLVRPALFIPSTKRLLDLLEEMRSQGHSLAVLVDEFGGTMGIVTEDDLWSALIGKPALPPRMEEETLLQDAA